MGVAPTIRNSSAASNTGGSLAVPRPSGLVVGDYMVAWHYADNDGVLASMGAPSGWSLLGSDPGASGADPYVKVWTRVATSADTTATSFTFTDTTASIFNSVVTLAITAGTYDATTPVTGVTFLSGSASTLHTAPSIPGVASGLLCTSHGSDTGGTAATYTPPSGMTEQADTNSGTGSYTALEVCTLPLTSTASTGNKTATCTTSRPWKGSSLIVNPAGATALGTRTNLSTNPACKNDAVGWTGPSGWARAAGLGVSLPRQTGFTGTTAGDVVTPRAQVTAGQQYSWAVWVRALVDLTSSLQVNYYNSTGGFVANSGAAVPLNLTTGNTSRFTLGPYTVPAGAVSGELRLIALDGRAEVTAAQVESSSTFGAYFDGDSLGALWNGTDGDSTSTIRQSGDTLHVADVFTVAVTAPVGPPPFSDGFGVGEFHSIAASGGLFDSAAVIDGFLVASLEWDPVRGRNRISAFTFAPNVVQARVSRRRVIGGSWKVVRGGTVTVVNGLMPHPVDDYEFPSGVDFEYLIEGVGGAASGNLVLQSATVRRLSVADAVWLKFITAPALNQRLEYMGRTEITRASRTAVYDVQGRSDPVVVSDVHSSRRFTIRCKTETPSAADTLDHALSRGLPCYLQVPETINTPSVYAVIGDYRHEPPALKSSRSVFTIPLIEVAAPPPSIVSPYATWSSVLALYGSWEELIANVDTWQHTAD